MWFLTFIPLVCFFYKFRFKLAIQAFDLAYRCKCFFCPPRLPDVERPEPYKEVNKIIAIKVFSHSQPVVTLNLDHDLSVSPYHINIEQIKEACEIEKIDVLEIEYIHDNEKFIIALAAEHLTDLTLPIYDEPIIKDLKIDISWSEGLENFNEDAIIETLKKYSGPRGNFYQDIGLTILPRVININGKPLFSSFEQTLKFGSNIEEFEIQSGKPIKVNSLLEVF